jgi:hypothetical protein
MCTYLSNNIIVNKNYYLWVANKGKQGNGNSVTGCILYKYCINNRVIRELFCLPYQ